MDYFRREALMALTAIIGISAAAPVLAQRLVAQAVSPTPARSVPESGETPLLELGKPFEKTLSNGQHHVYRVLLKSGQFARILADQKSIDIVIVLLDPSGQKLRETDQYQDGPERVSFVAEASGFYRVEVRPSETDAVAGRYEIRIEDIRPEGPNDRVRAEAERADDDSVVLRGEGTPESRRKAIDKGLEALALWQRIDDPKEEALTLRMLGDFHAEAGDHARAIEYLERALPISQRAGDRLGEFNVQDDLGRFLRRVGQLQKALEHYRQALEIARSLETRRYLAGALNNISLVYWKLGQPDPALEALNEALPIARDVRDRRIEANVLTNMSLVWLDLDDPRKALDVLIPVPDLWKILEDREGEANALSNLGLAYERLGEHQKALDYYSRALPIVREVGERYGEAYVLTNLGGVYDNLGEDAKALDVFRQALPIRREVGDLDGEAATLRSLAKTEARLGYLAESREHVEHALSNYEILRANVLSPEQRSSFFALVRPTYDFYVDLLMRLHAKDPTKGLDALALQASEKSRARSLVEVLSEARVGIREGIDPALLEREASLRQKLRSSVETEMRVLSGKHTEDEAKATKSAVGSVSAEIEQVDAQIRAQSPRYASLARPQPLALSDVQRELDAETILLEYALGETRSFLWAVSDSGMVTYELPKRLEIESQARIVYDRLRAAPTGHADPLTYLTESRRLADMVLGPAASSLRKKRLVIVADGALQFIPFEALPVPGSDAPRGEATPPLVANHEIVNLPSAATLAVLRRGIEGRKPAPKVLAVLADPVFEKDDARVKKKVLRPEQVGAVRAEGGDQMPETVPALSRSARDLGMEEGTGGIARLPFTRREAREILALVPEGERKEALDFNASRATATSEDLSQYRFVHFATHGFLDSAHPELSGIVLSLVDVNGTALDGFLPAFDVLHLKLPADLIVLSACRTALGKEIRGEGLVGLTRAFMYAGSPRVVASLWRVDDAATAELMKRFYREMLGPRKLSPSAALREAQVSLRAEPRWAHPYYWAAFVLQGEWR